jgi:hypothetical protein
MIYLLTNTKFLPGEREKQREERRGERDRDRDRICMWVRQRTEIII